MIGAIALLCCMQWSAPVGASPSVTGSDASDVSDDGAAPLAPADAACVEWLHRALDRRGYSLQWVERTAADGPSIVDAVPELPRNAAQVAIAVRGSTGHVVAPFLRYAQARRIVARAAGHEQLSFRCALASEVAIAASGEARMRLPLVAIALLALAVAAAALRRPAASQKAK